MLGRADLVDSSLDIDTREGEILALQHNYWQEMNVTNVISTQQMNVLLEYDKMSIEDRKDILDERGAELCPLFISILAHPENGERVDYVLTIMNQMLSAHPNQASHFNSVDNCFDPFFSLIERKSGSEYTVAMAARVLAHLLSQAEGEAKSTSRFLSCLVGKINGVAGGDFKGANSTAGGNQAANQLIPLLLALKIILKANPNRRADDCNPAELFVASDGIESLIGVLNNKTIAKNTQTLYVCGFCLWLLSMHDSLLPRLKANDVILPLVNTIKTVSREKVVRICFSSFRNLLEKTTTDTEADQDEKKEKKQEAKIQDLRFAEDMVGQQLHKHVERLLQQSWKDADLVRSLEFVHSRLRVVLRHLSSFGMYEAEVNGGALDRHSPVHTEDFWRNNYLSFEARQFYLIRKIIEFLDLTAGKSDDTLEMACFDLGEFARFHPDGRRIIQMFHGKPKLMLLMTHSNQAVAKQALLCVQKIMLTNWEALDKSASGGLASLSR